MIDNLAALEQVRSTAIDLGMKFGPRLFVAIIIMAIGLAVARWAATGTSRLLRRFEFEPPVRQLLENIARILVLILFGMLALQNLGVELLPLIAGLGIAGAGVALAMQGVLGNLVAGLTIILSRPFRVGEYVSIANEEGEVAEVTLFSTTLSHPDLSRVVIPNRRIVGEILHNYGQLRQLQIVARVAYDTDLDRALATARDTLARNPRVLRDPAPVIKVVQLADSSINIGVNPWVKVTDYVDASGEIYKSIVEAFRGQGIVIPFPQRDVRMVGAAA